jgi:hypothetical protein
LQTNNSLQLISLGLFYGEKVRDFSKIRPEARDGISLPLQVAFEAAQLAGVGHAALLEVLDQPLETGLSHVAGLVGVIQLLSLLTQHGHHYSIFPLLLADGTKFRICFLNLIFQPRIFTKLTFSLDLHFFKSLFHFAQRIVVLRCQILR